MKNKGYAGISVAVLLAELCGLGLAAVNSFLPIGPLGSLPILFVVNLLLQHLALYQLDPERIKAVRRISCLVLLVPVLLLVVAGGLGIFLATGWDILLYALLLALGVALLVVNALHWVGLTLLRAHRIAKQAVMQPGGPQADPPEPSVADFPPDSTIPPPDPDQGAGEGDYWLEGGYSPPDLPADTPDSDMEPPSS